jgi:hypothetical protein
MGITSFRPAWVDLEIGDEGFIGLNDEVRIFGVALSSDIIQQRRAKKLLPTEQDLKVYYDFDDVIFTVERPGVPDLVNEEQYGRMRDEQSSVMPPNAPLSDSSLEMVLHKLACYLPFDDGRYAATVSMTNSADDFLYRSLGWDLGRPFAGTLVDGCDFWPLTTNDALVTEFPFMSDSPISLDGDDDGMPDVFEVFFGFDRTAKRCRTTPTCSPTAIPTATVSTTCTSIMRGTDPWFFDSDENGVPDADGIRTVTA